MDQWRRLPDVYIPPKYNTEVKYFADTTMRVWKDQAWLFFGCKRMLKFDLHLEQWFLFDTEWDSAEPWPYKKELAVEYCAEIFDGKLHIFGGWGGSDSDTETISIGMNLHMCLDLRTLKWTKLGGTNDPQKHIPGMPTLRKACGSWVAPHEKKMYILHGIACRPESAIGYFNHQYEDAWSYSFATQIWARERLRGNFPAARCNMACVYHPALDQVLVFGGSNVRLPTQHPRMMSFMTYFADTFILDMKTKIWKQVLTRDFPHHRMSAHMNVDVDTGRIYLYGGM